MKFSLRLTLLLALLAASGCGQNRQNLSPVEIEQTAWYVEDVAHGLSRQPAELITVDASETFLRIARWAQGNRHDGRMVSQPDPLQQRLQRWPLIAQGLSQGLVAYTEGGQLRMVADEVAKLPEDDPLLALLIPAVADENGDRIRTSRILIGLAGLGRELQPQQRLVDAFHSARRQHAGDAGGSLWTEPSPSSSPDEPTPSASPRASLPRREP